MWREIKSKIRWGVLGIFGRQTIAVKASAVSLVFATMAAAALLIGGGAAALWLGNTTQVKNNGVDPSLVGWWKLNGNAKDSSGHGNNGTWSGVTNYVANQNGMSKSAARFEGTASAITVPSKIITTPNFSVSIWAYNYSYTPRQDETILSDQTDSSDSGFVFSYNTTISKWTLYYGDGQGSGASHWHTLNSGISFPTDAWTNIVYSQNGSTTSIYVNGVLAISRTDSAVPSFASASNLRIGDASDGATTGENRFFYGALSDLRIYNRALSTSEASRLYNPPKAQIDSSQQGLIGWWKLNGNLKDSTPYARNLQDTNANTTLTIDRKGAPNSAYKLNGNACLATNLTTTYPNIRTGTWSYSVWFYPTSTTSSSTLLSLYNSAYIHTDLNIVSSGMLVTNNGGTGNLVTAAVIPSLNTWHLATYTYDGTTNRLYLDGKSIASSTAAPASGTDGAWNPKITIGAWNNNTNLDCTYGRFTGSISDVRLYNRALSTSEIKTQYQSYNSQLDLQSPNPSGSVNLNYGLTGYWPFNNNANDMTPYQDNGAVSGATLITDRNGRANSAYEVNSLTTNSSISIPYEPQLQLNGKWTLSLWVKDDGSTTEYPRLLSYDSNNGGTGSWIIYENNNSGGWNNDFKRDGLENYIPIAQANLAIWHLTTFTYDGTNLKLYYNGVLQKTNARSLTAITAQRALTVGNVAGADFSLDDLRIYNRDLSAAEVQALYNTYN